MDLLIWLIPAAIAACCVWGVIVSRRSNDEDDEA